jgi:hypothetical protein
MSAVENKAPAVPAIPSVQVRTINTRKKMEIELEKKVKKLNMI